MLETLIAPAIGFIATALAIWLLKPVAEMVGLVDRPAERKQHAGEIPLIGGISIFCGASVAIVSGIAFGLIQQPLKIGRAHV